MPSALLSFSFGNFFAFSSYFGLSFLTATRDEHGWGLDRIWPGLNPILAGSGLDRTAILLKIDVSGLDRTEKNICCFNVVI